MRWSDDAFVLSARRHGESALLVHVLTAAHGRHAGLVRGGQRPKTRAVWQVGNRVHAAWSARLAEHLGSLQGELAEANAALLIDAPARLACLAAAAALADAVLPEREPHAAAHAGLAALLDALRRGQGWETLYVRWELDLLAQLGFGLDLARCAVTGAAADLAYVSPRTGRAVSSSAAAPWRDRLLALPGFLGDASARASGADLLAGLTLTGYFLAERVFTPDGRKLPAARTRFVDVMRQSATISGR